MRLFLSCSVLSLLIACQSDRNKTAKPYVSTNPILTFENPAKPSSSLPRLSVAGNSLYMSWVTKEGEEATLWYSNYSDGSWKSPFAIAQSDSWFVNWADFPYIAINNDVVVTNVLEKSAAGTYMYDIKLDVIVEADTIQRIGQNLPLHTDGTKSEHGFVSMVPYGEEEFFVTWLDGRNTVANSSHSHEIHSSQTAAMTLRSAVVGRDGSISQETELDRRVCDCCATAAVMTSQGPMVVYRDRSNDEVRDIYKVRWKEGAWSQPEVLHPDGWNISGCPVNGPSASAKGTSVAVAWFTAAQDEPRVLAAFSEDAGATFRAPVRLDKGPAIGRVDIQMISSRHAVVSWMEEQDDAAVVQLQKVSATGASGRPISITRTLPDRAAGFPQLEVLNDTAIVAWTSLDGLRSEIRSVKIPLKAL